MKIKEVIIAEAIGSTEPSGTQGTTQSTPTDGHVWPPEPPESETNQTGNNVSKGYYEILQTIQNLSYQEALALLKALK